MTARNHLASLVLASVAAVAANASGPQRAAVSIADLQPLYEASDYFALRDRLAESPQEVTPAIRFYRAVVASAFNDAARSNDIVRELLAADDSLVPAPLTTELLVLKRRNDLRLYRYRDAALDAKRLLDMRDADPEALEDARNDLKVLEALANVPPQTASVAGDTEIRFQSSSMGGRCVPVRIGVLDRCFILDTGANFSVLMATEAKALGLQVRSAGVRVDTSTDRSVTADVAVADQVTIGRIAYRHVVFLVLPDALLTFPDGGRIPGILGFPIIEAMGQVGFGQDGVLRVPRTASDQPKGTLALHALDLVTRVKYAGSTLVCRVDSGADRTVFYEPFFRRFSADVQRLGTSRTIKTAGAGGVREIPGYTLDTIGLEVASRRLRLNAVDVYTVAIAKPLENRFDCNLALDALQQAGGYTLNFRAMSLVLGP